MEPISLYINWALHALYGRLGEADYLMQRASAEIRLVADFLASRHPLASRPIHRGVLLDPSMGLGTHYPFVSWSEDRDVACWFADRHSYISEPFAAYAPEARGYLLALPAPKSRVLFHYSWRNAFDVPLEQLALLHPQMGHEAKRQIAWSLDRQHEVITEPVENLALAPYEASPGETIRLDRKFTPSWLDVEAAPEGKPEGMHRGMSAPRAKSSSAT